MGKLNVSGSAVGEQFCNEHQRLNATRQRNKYWKCSVMHAGTAAAFDSIEGIYEEINSSPILLLLVIGSGLYAALT